MYAVVTGASSGIGRAIAIQLARRGYDLIAAARREERLQKLKYKIEKRYRVKVIPMECDLSLITNCYQLYERCREYPVEILVNCAGFGKIGRFEEIPLENEIAMIHTNILAAHILTKLFLKSIKRGRILNVASIAGFQPDPVMTTYGATKSYMVSFSRALNYELKRQSRKVFVSTLCPGPVRTEFDKIANSNFSLRYISAEKCARIAVDGLFRNKELIIPDIRIRLLYTLSRLLPIRLILPFEYRIQSSKLHR